MTVYFVVVTQSAKNGAYVVVLEFSGVFGTVVDLWVRREEGGGGASEGCGCVYAECLASSH